MATAYTVIGSRFKPFSFQELVQPLEMYRQEYQRQEDLYNTYAETAGLIGADLNPEYDSDVLNNTYNPYMRELNEAASELSSEGLSLKSRKSLQELKRRFGAEISPIKVASESRRKAQENWNKMSAQDRTLMTNANPYYKGVSDYMNGKSPETYYVSGNELYGRGKALAEAFSKTLRSVPDGEQLSAQLGNQYFRIIRQYGPDSQQMQDFMNDVANSIPELRSQVSDILNNTDIFKEGFTEADRNRAEQYILEGMKAGLSGNTETQYLQNHNFISDERGKKGKEEEDSLPILPTFQISMGHDEKTNDVSDLEKLAQTLTLSGGSGLSNTELDSLIAQYEESLDIISDIESKYGNYTEESNTPSGSLGTPGATALSKAMNTSTSKRKYFIKDGKRTYIDDLTPEERRAYTKARNNIYGMVATGNAPYDRMSKIQEQLDNLTERYSHIPGKDIIESINLGIALDKAQRERTGIVPRVTPTEQKNSIDSILNGVSASIGTDKSKTKGLIDLETGKIISKSDLDKLIHDNNVTEGRFRIISTDSEPIAIHDKDTGKTYAPHGSIAEIDDYRNRVSSINNFLKDYSNSKEGISNPDIELSEFSLNILNTYGKMPIQGGMNLGKGYYGFITYTGDGDVIKLVVEEDPTTGYGTLIGSSSLKDEINGGLVRGSFLKDSAEGFLYDIFVKNKM